jgi:hypothetical protein
LKISNPARETMVFPCQHINQRRYKMNLRNLFRVLALLLLLGGLGWLVAPQSATLGELDSYGLYVVQQLGATTVAIAVLYFLVSGMSPSPARQAAVTAVIVQQLLSGIVNLLSVLGGSIPSGRGWFGVGFSLVFVLVFGYFRFVRPEEA